MGVLNVFESAMRGGVLMFWSSCSGFVADGYVGFIVSDDVDVVLVLVFVALYWRRVRLNQAICWILSNECNGLKEFF